MKISKQLLEQCGIENNSLFEWKWGKEKSTVTDINKNTEDIATELLSKINTVGAYLPGDFITMEDKGHENVKADVERILKIKIKNNYHLNERETSECINIIFNRIRKFRDSWYKKMGWDVG